jgi:hypothetical protein
MVDRYGIPIAYEIEFSYGIQYAYCKYDARSLRVQRSEEGEGLGRIV